MPEPKKRRSQRVTKESDALDLEDGVFSKHDPRSIARCLNAPPTAVIVESAIASDRRCPCSPFTSIGPETRFRRAAARGLNPRNRNCANFMDVVFVSSNRWDVMGATSFGFRAVWVNRARLPQEYPHQPAAHAVPDLAELPSLTL